MTQHVKSVTNSRGLAKYRGITPFTGRWNQWMQYNINPQLKDQIKLVAETERFLYTKYTPTEVKHKWGTRPALEGLIQTVILRGKDGLSKEQISRRMFEWCHWEVHMRATRLLNSHHWPKAFRYLGTEEEIVSFQTSTDCYMLCRLIVTLLQIAGIPARLVFLFHKNEELAHTVFEAYIKNRWFLADALQHVHFKNGKGKPASAWEIKSDPYCTTKGFLGWNDGYYSRYNKHPDVADIDYFDQVAVVNYPLKESTSVYCTWKK